MKKERKEKAIIFVFMCIIMCFLLFRAVKCKFSYAEVDSNALPVISLQYRGSILVNQSDIDRAKKDFRRLYKDVNDYNGLRSAKLIKITEDVWMPYYFPIYPLFCIPVKLLLSLAHRNQMRTFSITNALLMLLAFYFVLVKLKRTLPQRVVAAILLFFSPAVFYYYNYINYEVLIFSMLTIALVQYSNKKYKSSAVALSLAGMANSAVMAVGVVMILDYIGRVLYQKRRLTWVQLIKNNVRETILYALCFVPCLIPFIVQRWYLHGLTFSVEASQSKGLGGRFLMYLFDPTLGIPTFAPLGIVFFCLLVGWGILKKRKGALLFGGFLASTVLAVSLMTHINCGMIFCARYVAWIYPIVAIFLATEGWELIRTAGSRICIYSAILLTSLLVQFVNYGDVGSYNFNTATRWVLNNLPGLYNPLSSTFYCRTLHKDGAYDMAMPAYYSDPASGEVRKLIYKAETGVKEQMLSELTGDSASMEDLERRIDRIGYDGKFHYLNYPVSGAYRLRAKNLAEILNLTEEKVLFDDQDFYLSRSGYPSYVHPFAIKKNTVYKVELELDPSFDLGLVQYMIVDFYADGYDYSEQERTIVDENGCKQVFYIYSGEFDDLIKEAYARIVCFTGAPRVKRHIVRFKLSEFLTRENQVV